MQVFLLIFYITADLEFIRSNKFILTGEVTHMASIILKNLNKIYPNGFVSVKDVSLTIEDGEFVTFHGPSGCGKYTI